MPKLLRAEAADFQVVLEQGAPVGQLVGRWSKELPLMQITRPPREHAADVQAFPFHLQEHVLGPHAFGGARVVGAARRVDVVVAAEETIGLRIDPAGKFDIEAGRSRGGDVHLALDHAVLGPAAGLQGKLARREQHDVAMFAVNLRLKEKVGCEPLGLRWVDAAAGVAKDEPAHSRRAVVVGNRQRDRDGGADFEANFRFSVRGFFLGLVLFLIARQESKANFCVALAADAAVDESDDIFDFQAAESVGHRGRRVHFDGEEAVRIATGILIGVELGLSLSRQAPQAGAGVHRAVLGAADGQPPLQCSRIEYFHHDRREPGLLELGGRRPPAYLKAVLGQRHREHCARVEQLLKLGRILFAGRLLDCDGFFIRNRRAERLQCFQQSSRIRGQRLAFDGDAGKVVGTGRRGS